MTIGHEGICIKCGRVHSDAYAFSHRNCVI
jgi:hypothetical protein